MATATLHFGIVKRSEGKSSVGGAAYIAGCYMVDLLTKIVHNHSYKWDVRHDEIMAPEGSPQWVFDRKILWNKVEASESWKTAQVAREGYAALPRELTKAQNIELAREFLQHTFVARGMVVDWAFHDTPASDGKRNPHIHFQMTMREIDKETGEFCKQKNRSWNDQNNVDIWRKSFEVKVNRSLENAGSKARIDMRSYTDQGVDKIAQVHMGKDATVLENQGVRTCKGDHNRRARMLNFMKESAKHAGNWATDLSVHSFEYVRKWFSEKRKKSTENDTLLQQQHAHNNNQQGR